LRELNIKTKENVCVRQKGNVKFAWGQQFEVLIEHLSSQLGICFGGAAGARPLHFLHRILVQKGLLFSAPIKGDQERDVKPHLWAKLDRWD